jgi:Asp-tRNA(Asn)/Glu-tRNA(Gln) amidotransferase A subunit family amidase
MSDAAGDLTKLTASAAVAAIKAGTLKPSVLMEACLARIAARDKEIGAFARLNPDARRRAAAADRLPPTAPLHGVPVAIKDIIDTGGLGTEYGSPIHRGNMPVVDAECVTRLKNAGAIVIGKTVTTEFAHVTPQATKNPRDVARTPGGSSSGSAAAVADDMAPIALGTQTGGSVIRPASYCGIFGFKSSIGRTGTKGVHELARSFDTVGWMARSAADLALLGRVLLTAPTSAAELAERPRLACLTTPYDTQAAPAALAARDDAAIRLAAAGAEVRALALPASFGALNALHRRICSVDASRAFARYATGHPDKLSPALTEFIALGRRNEGGYVEAQQLADAARAELSSLMTGLDGLILPAATGEAPEGLASTGDATFSLFLSLLGPPCLTLPVGKGASGLPIGVQLVGRRGDDEALLALGEWAASRLSLA